MISKSVAGADVFELCTHGEAMANDMLTKVYNKKELEGGKGIAFPVCISVNEICGHFSPLSEESVTLKAGDVVKIDLGIHIDGFIGMAGHTIVVASGDQSAEPGQKSEEGEDAPAPKASPVTGKKADAVLAAYKAAQAVYRLMRPGNFNTQGTAKIAEICADFGVNPVEGVLSHELNQNLIDDNFCVINKAKTGEQEVEEKEYEVNQVIGVDVFVSTGEGQPQIVSSDP